MLYRTIPDPDFPAPTPSKPTPSSSTSKPTPSPPPTKPVYFWKPTSGNGYLGQWFWSPFTLSPDTYATAEMYMMVSKARLFNDEPTAKKMLATTDPKRHKALGRQVVGFDEGVWEERAYYLYLHPHLS